MPKSWQLKQTKQCKNCPWRKDSDLSQIPDYSEEQHRDLERTIVDNNIDSFNPIAPVAFMACHNGTAISTNLECTGWLHNQLTGHNLGLRIRLRSCTNLRELEVVGEQFDTFEETLPENR